MYSEEGRGGMRRRGEMYLHLFQVGRNLDLFHLLKHFHTGLYLFCLAVLVPEPFNEFFCLLFLFFLFLSFLLKLFYLRETGSDIVRVITFIAGELSVEQFIDFADCFIKEVLVVRDNKNRSAEPVYEVPQPDTGFDIEIVCRFVKEQDISILNENLCKGDSHLPSPAELLTPAFEITGCETQPLRDLFYNCLSPVIGTVKESLLFFMEIDEISLVRSLLRGNGKPFLENSDLFQQWKIVIESLEHLVVERGAFVSDPSLGKIGYPETFRD